MSTITSRFRATVNDERWLPWIGGIWVGLQSVILGFLIVALPVVISLVTTASAASNAKTSWSDVYTVATSVWLLGHFGTVETSTAAISIAPLGLTALFVFLCWGFTRRTAVIRAETWLASVATYAIVVLVLAIPAFPSPIGIVQAVLGAILISAVPGWVAVMQTRRLLPEQDLPPLAQAPIDTVTERISEEWSRLPEWVISALKACGIALLVLIAEGALLTVVWIATQHETINTIMLGLRADVAGSVVLALSQIILLPNLIVWGMAWILGAGFVVGTGTLWSMWGVTSGPLPAIPLLGSLPHQPSWFEGPWLLVLPVIAGGIAGWWLYRDLSIDETPRWRTTFYSTGVCSLAIGFSVVLLMWASSGSSGPGRLTQVEPRIWIAGGAAFVETAIGLLIVLTMLRPSITSRMRRLVKRRPRES